MSLRPTSYELTQQAIDATYERALDAHTVEDAIRCHSELVDLLAIEAMIVRVSSRSEAVKANMIREINESAEYHRDAVDRLTDIIEQGRQFIWRHE
ncbi:hypothetical protein [Hyphomicrobium sp.]|uniref:hypothetical protein n=1 Tax=Hyphomicrobium sp. TaxID=82 RepID=UPI000F99DA77|nr:hypothetical protein [Hyphomicrobium sp.]RUO99284.1 MAG: hypothetical protein EKK30_08655 [Hyphomicrobium sp.]